MQEQEIIYLGLGSNLGDRKAALRAAIAALQARRVQVLQQSAMYETPPWGKINQPSFMNMAIAAAFDGDAWDLLRIAMEVETELGRERIVRWGPRIIDLDILMFGNRTIASQRLTIPHPFLSERAFVLVPLADIAADVIVPGEGLTVNELLEALDPEDVEKVTRK